MSTRALARPSFGVLEKAGRLDWIWQLAFIGAHVPLALMLRKNSSEITWHALLVLLGGAVLALTTRRWERVACVAAYITGAEVYWRMRRAHIPWEFGKYAVVLVLGIAILRFGRFRKAAMPSAYFLLLLPSTLLTLETLRGEEMQEQLSFNMSGPLSLAVCAIFFSSIRMTKREMKWFLTFLVAPVVSIATIASVTLQKLQKYAEPEFGNSASRVASGGFGPNQVSAALGLGILAVFFIMVIGVGNAVAAGSFVLLMLFLVRQCAITFSRGGLWMAVGGILSAAFYLARDKRTRLRLLGIAVIVLPLLVFVVWPKLEALTSGAIGTRFANTDSTGRDLLVKGDLLTWSENPVLGSGPGLGGKNRLKYFHVTTAHTEYSRMLAEHGTLGLIALGLMVWMAFRNVWYAPTRLDKALAAAMLAYSVLNMLVDGMRLAAVGFTFGLSGMRFLLPRRRAAVAPPRAETPRTEVAAPQARQG
jgi:O-Antigen ligase